MVFFGSYKFFNLFQKRFQKKLSFLVEADDIFITPILTKIIFYIGSYTDFNSLKANFILPIFAFFEKINYFTTNSFFNYWNKNF